MEAQLIICQTKEDFSIAKKLTKDYMAWLEMDLCFQGIENELATFNNMYNKPTGCFIYIKVNDVVAGGVGMRLLSENDICEMKRLYVYEQFRGQQIGLILCQKLIKISQLMGYNKMRLDTVSKLQKAIKLYNSLGFLEIPPYCENPDKTVKYMELEF